MTDTLDVDPYLAAWLAAHCPALGGRVYPGDGVQDATAPYATYHLLGQEPETDQHGLTSGCDTSYQVDVWALTRAAAAGPAKAVIGTKSAPGLVALAGLLGAPGTAGALRVYAVTLDDHFSEFQKAPTGKASGWCRQCVRLTIHPTTTLE